MALDSDFQLFCCLLQHDCYHVKKPTHEELDKRAEERTSIIAGIRPIELHLEVGEVEVKPIKGKEIVEVVQ